MQHSFVTIAIPFDASRAGAVEADLGTLGHPARPDIRDALDATEIVHFMSINVIHGDPGKKAHLVIEASVDGGDVAAIERLAAALDAPLKQALELAGIRRGTRTLSDLLASHRLNVGQGWFSTAGLNFDGTPGLSVVRVRREAKLAATISNMLERGPRFETARAALEHVRTELWRDHAAKWAFVAESAPFLTDKAPLSKVVLAISLAAIKSFLWPFVLALAAAFGLAWVLWDFATAMWVTGLVFAAEIGFLFLGYLLLRRKEERDVPEDIGPSSDHIRAMMEVESTGAQGLLAAVSVKKPGYLRWFTLRLGLWAAAVAGGYRSRPGFLTHIGVIHFARWILLPGTGKLLFFSNYDGAWESYVEDFIERGATGVTAIWSNTVGFPRTRNLFREGARDGDRLRRWTRRQMYPSRFWYSAYPGLTLARIRTNAAIRQGIAIAATEAEAADWLAGFGSAPRPAATIEAAEVPTLAFGGLKRLRYGTCLLVRFAEGADEDTNRAKAKAWLAGVQDDVAYGERVVEDTAVVLGFTAGGLRKLGLKQRHLETFPVPFQQGNDAPWRARALGDVGDDDPKEWLWGGPRNKIDAVMNLYAVDADGLEKLVAKQTRALALHGHAIAHTMPFAPLPPKGEPLNEPFGYLDGVSQPLIRGTRRATRKTEHHQAVEPGEFILGYPDNLGYIPATPAVPASDDPLNILPAVAAASGLRPNFAAPLADGQHDIGRNGTFLVVRQLEQDVEAFDDFLAEAAKQLVASKRAPFDDPERPERLRDWIGAKIVGRWKDGSPLVRHPESPAGNTGPRADNDFLFGVEDPNGMRCPFGAHIRRANPRESFDPGSKTQLTITNRHRILRVGRIYAPPTEFDKCGLAFMCLNADIERQFEFVQQTWLLAPSFHGLEHEADGVLGHGGASDTITIPMAGGPLRVCGMKRFVTVRGGGYFFLPGRRAMRFLAHRAGAAA